MAESNEVLLEAELALVDGVIDYRGEPAVRSNLVIGDPPGLSYISEQIVTLAPDFAPRCHIGPWFRIKYKQVPDSTLPLSL